jgi:hypothetical protein
LGYIVGQGIF